MAEAGFLYVLINPSMPSLVKIGKTTRDPDDRVLELSGATGIPVPFILVYSLPIADCDRGEAHAHALLEYRRLATNREVFSCTPTEAINAVLQAGLVRAEPDTSTQTVTATAQGMIPTSAVSIVDEILQQALIDYEGTGTYGNDHTAAFKNFRKAAKLGHVIAKRYVGECYEYGRGVKGDAEKSFAAYKEAAEAGDSGAFWPMARLYCRALGSSPGHSQSRMLALRFLNQHLERNPDGGKTLLLEAPLLENLLLPSLGMVLPVDFQSQAASTLHRLLKAIRDEKQMLPSVLDAVKDWKTAWSLVALFRSAGMRAQALRTWLFAINIDTEAHRQNGSDKPTTDHIIEFHMGKNGYILGPDFGLLKKLRDNSNEQQQQQDSDFRKEFLALLARRYGKGGCQNVRKAIIVSLLDRAGYFTGHEMEEFCKALVTKQKSS